MWYTHVATKKNVLAFQKCIIFIAIIRHSFVIEHSACHFIKKNSKIYPTVGSLTVESGPVVDAVESGPVVDAVESGDEEDEALVDADVESKQNIVSATPSLCARKTRKRENEKSEKCEKTRNEKIPKCEKSHKSEKIGKNEKNKEIRKTKTMKINLWKKRKRREEIPVDVDVVEVVVVVEVEVELVESSYVYVLCKFKQIIKKRLEKLKISERNTAPTILVPRFPLLNACGHLLVAQHSQKRRKIITFRNGNFVRTCYKNGCT
jgi:hypothetical protein